MHYAVVRAAVNKHLNWAVQLHISTSTSIVQMTTWLWRPYWTAQSSNFHFPCYVFFFAARAIFSSRIKEWYVHECVGWVSTVCACACVSASVTKWARYISKLIFGVEVAHDWRRTEGQTSVRAIELDLEKNEVREAMSHTFNWQYIGFSIKTYGAML